MKETELETFLAGQLEFQKTASVPSSFPPLYPAVGTPEIPLNRDEMFDTLLSSLSCTQEQAQTLQNVYVYAQSQIEKIGIIYRKNEIDETITHSLWQAIFLARNGVTNTDVLCASILHDTVEDTDATFEDIERLTNSSVRKLVEGVSKIKTEKLVGETKAQHKVREQQETLLKIIEVAREDPRVLMIKAADIIHNQLTSDALADKSARAKKAAIALSFFEPVVRDFGLTYFADMIGETAFRTTNPERYEKMLANQNHVIEAVLPKYLDIVQRWVELGTADEETLHRSHVAIVFPGIYEAYQKAQADEVGKITDKYYLPKIRILCHDNSSSARWFTFFKDNYHPENINPEQVVLEERPVVLSFPTKNLANLEITADVAEYFPPLEEILVEMVTNNLLVKPSDIFINGGISDHAEARVAQRKLQELQLSWSEALMQRGTTITETVESARKGRVLVYDKDNAPHALMKGYTAGDLAYSIGENLGNHAIAVRVWGSEAILPLNTVLESGQRYEFITEESHLVASDKYDMVTSPRAIDAIRKAISVQIEKYAKHGQKHPTARAILAGQIVPNLHTILGFRDGDNSEQTDEFQEFLQKIRERGEQIINEIYKTKKGKNLDTYIQDVLTGDLAEIFGEGNIDSFLLNVGLIDAPIKSIAANDRHLKLKAEKSLRYAHIAVDKLIQNRNNMYVLEFTLPDAPGVLAFIGKAIEKVSGDTQIRSHPTNAPGKIAAVELVFMEGGEKTVKALTKMLLGRYGEDLEIIYSGLEKDGHEK